MKTLEQIREAMTQRGLADYYEQLAPFARNLIRITPEACDDGDIPVGASKFGGCPDLPAGVEWFGYGVDDCYLDFVAQINFAQTAPFDTAHKLPERGMLYFFYDGAFDSRYPYFNSGKWVNWKLYFYDGDLSALSRREPPAGFGEFENGRLYGAARMYFEADLELPPMESDLVLYRTFPDDKESYRRYLDWQEETDPGCYSQMLGHAHVMLNGFERACECLRQGLDCFEPSLQELEDRGLDRDLRHWQVLLQVDSDRRTGMIWSDMGWLCLWITDEDLAARRFGNCLVMTESG